MKNDSPIGFFDSGVGGTSIWKEVHQLLPYEHTIYLADSHNAPYGYKSAEEILELSIKNTEQLLAMGCKAIVVACNTATTNAVLHLRSAYPVPFVGIEPAIKPAALKTTSMSIGILATKGTLNSELFHSTSEAFTKDISVIEVIGEGLVSLVEAGELESPKMMNLLAKYVAPMLKAKVDYIVLGCTHYPYLIPSLRKLVPAHVQIIDSGAAAAIQTKTVLGGMDLLRKETSIPQLEFYSNADTTTLALLLKDCSSPLTISQLDF